MRYEVLIMLALVGAVNLVGRVLAKRAETRSKQQSGPDASTRAPSSAGRQPAPRITRQPVLRSQPATSAGSSSSVRAPLAVVPEAVSSTRPAPLRKSTAALAKPKPEPATTLRNRWDARTLRRAFVVSELLGEPVGFRR